MRRLRILKLFTDILYTLSLIGLFFGVPFLFTLVLWPQTVPFKILDVSATEIPTEEIILLFVGALGGAAYIYALYLFRKVLTSFRNKKFFAPEVITNFDQIGKAIIVGYLLCDMPYYVYSWFATPVLSVEDPDWITNAFFNLALGLFFIVLSEVFLTAKTMKEENDLTV